ncbi:hypothetical protein WH50_16050 [Pokkaliibacter plantistimulans]|uniref:HTH tetR-type domain-containing protein n=1 Tax=Pokkaliibacter plantistimulans TaxID=1635171 RepID=A0ABX5LUI3_9GAMM|nr:TetR/AcrR family transcriptional regulator [Pokkaliibacter plantistimulans]PXF30319.1 hypothetical protein WH50_16050 [Pokkaliibacter plantistimulans]
MASGRPRTFAEDDVLQAATRTFWQQGYDGTSLQDLLEATGLSKSSLYQSFGNKQQLFHACVQRYAEHSVSNLRQQLQASATVQAFLREWLGTALRECGGDDSGQPARVPRGCMLVNVATEFSQRDPQLAAIIDNGMVAIRAVIAEALRQGQGNDPRRNLWAENTAMTLHTLMVGLRTQVKAGVSAAALSAVIDQVISSLPLAE